MSILIKNIFFAKALSVPQILFPSSTPLAERIDKISPFFNPSLNSDINFDPYALQQYPYFKNNEVLSGLITLSPPKNTCFTIDRIARDETFRVCKTQFIPFYLDELDDLGELHWKIKTSPEDFGTPIMWNSPYRFAKMSTYGRAWPAPSEQVLIKTCESRRNENGYRIYVTLVSGKVFAISFPDVETQVPQPGKIPNLQMTGGDVGRGGFVDVQKTPEPPKGGHGGTTTQKNAEPNELVAQNTTWQLLPRQTYTMNGSHFIGDSSAPTASKGECRYNYNYPKTKSAALECHDVQNFQWIFLPLTCLKNNR